MRHLGDALQGLHRAAAIEVWAVQGLPIPNGVSGIRGDCQEIAYFQLVSRVVVLRPRSDRVARGWGAPPQPSCRPPGRRKPSASCRPDSSGTRVVPGKGLKGEMRGSDGGLHSHREQTWATHQSGSSRSKASREHSTSASSGRRLARLSPLSPDACDNARQFLKCHVDVRRHRVPPGRIEAVSELPYPFDHFSGRQRGLHLESV